ncbi:NADP-dependent oxidoreductase [Leifsonia poae]|uniref:NADP-dependent oxidoreductase n=1 Tax=Leifsonia poae TaxID=110933 RepID=UPI003D67F774
MSKTMKAARFHEYGGPLVIEDVPIPEPGPGQVLVKVAGSANNPADGAVRAGALQAMLPLDLPHTPGVEVSGTIESVGDGVTDLAAGDAVIAFLPMNAPGSAAEYVVGSAELFAAAPTAIPLADAAALPATGLTAQQALFEHGGLQSGQRVLINGAGGAVGGYAVQLAVLAGAEVIATASPASFDRVSAYGPAQVVDHTATPLREAIEGEVDLVFNVAPTPTDVLVGLVKPGGRIVSATSPIEQDAGAGVTGIRMGVHASAEQLDELVRKVDLGQLTVWVADRRPLEEINDVQAGGTKGKTVLVP